MTNERQFKVNTRFVATRGVKEYRESIAAWVNRDDVVLEIGSERSQTGDHPYTYYLPYQIFYPTRGGQVYPDRTWRTRAYRIVMERTVETTVGSFSEALEIAYGDAIAYLGWNHVFGAGIGLLQSGAYCSSDVGGYGGPVEQYNLVRAVVNGRDLPTSVEAATWGQLKGGRTERRERKAR